MLDYPTPEAQGVKRHPELTPFFMSPDTDRTVSEDPILARMIGFDLDADMARVSPAVLLPGGRLAVNLPRRLGRSQGVRQRILIPRYGGSNPPAPASLSYCCRRFKRGRRVPEDVTFSWSSV